MDIGVVIVTFNRLKKLKIALGRFEQQVLKPKYILIVDNGSTDGTSDFLKQWKNQHSSYNRIICCLNENTGGSGGFAYGFNEALKLDADWIWVSDDDAYPKKDALFEANRFIEANDCKDISAICGSVITDGKIDCVHRKRIHKKGSKVEFSCVGVDSYDMESFEINSFSYVGAIINKEILKKAGVTLKDYFIWWDDTEHSLRLGKYGKILCVPGIIVYHDIDEQNNELSWKDYYGFRNQLVTFKKHFPSYVFIISSIKMMVSAVKQLIVNKDYVLCRLKLCAAFDAIRGNMGLHEIYKPGWKPQR